MISLEHIVEEDNSQRVITLCQCADLVLVGAAEQQQVANSVADSLLNHLRQFVRCQQAVVLRRQHAHTHALLAFETAQAFARTFSGLAAMLGGMADKAAARAGGLAGDQAAADAGAGDFGLGLG